MAVGDQFLLFTGVLNEASVWTNRDTTTTVDTEEASPGGDTWYEVTVSNNNSYLNQDLDLDLATFASKRIQINIRVRPGAGNIAALGVTQLGSGLSAITEVDFNLGTQSVSNTSDSGGYISTESDTVTPSTFIEEEASGEYRIGLTIDTDALCDRIVFRVHQGQSTGAAATVEYSDANLIEVATGAPGDGLATYQRVTSGPQKLAPSHYINDIPERTYKAWSGANALNPDLPTEVGLTVFDFELADLSSPTTYQVATPAELISAINTAAGNLSGDHLIQVTTDTWEGLGDINITTDADFFTNGGKLAVTTQSGNKLVFDGSWDWGDGLSGFGWFNWKSTKRQDQYVDFSNLPVNDAAVRLRDGKKVLGDCELGIADQDDYEMLFSANALYSRSATSGTTTVVKRMKNSGGFNGVSLRGGQIFYIKDSYIDRVVEDFFYVNDNDSVATGPVQILRKNVTHGEPANEPICFLCVNTESRAWTGTIYPFVVGETVTQSNGFEATIVRRYEGDGVDNAPFMDNARNIAGDGGTGWKGDLLWLKHTENSTHYLEEGVAIVGGTSGASYTPALTVKSGAASLFDAGIILGILHTDSSQFGAANDDDGQTYEFFTAGWFSCLSAPNGGKVQNFIHNSGPNAIHKLYTRNMYDANSAIRAHPINHTDTVIQDSMITLAPLGSVEERLITDPGVGYSDGNTPQINVLDPLQDTTFDQVIDNVISSTNSIEGGIPDGFSYPYLSKVTVAIPNAADSSDTDSYETIFGTTLTRPYGDDYVFERRPEVPSNATLEQAQALIANWFDFYRTPVSDGGWDLTVSQLGSRWAHPLNYGKDYNAGRVPIISFTNWYAQDLEQGGTVVVPTFTATDGNEDLTSSVVVTNNVDTDTPGYQYIQYDVTNSDGNSVTTYSIVNVTPSTDPGGLDMGTTVKVDIAPGDGWVKVADGADTTGVYISNGSRASIIVAEAPTATPPLSNSNVGHKVDSYPGIRFNLESDQSLYAKAVGFWSGNVILTPE